MGGRRWDKVGVSASLMDKIFLNSTGVGLVSEKVKHKVGIPSRVSMPLSLTYLGI